MDIFSSEILSFTNGNNLFDEVNLELNAILSIALA